MTERDVIDLARQVSAASDPAWRIGIG